MKIEKLNENKIRIIFNHSDLQKNNVDVHSFMSNSIESQSLFLAMLDEAEREVGFITDNYKLSIEALALSNGVFIITVTRIEKENLKSTRVQAHRKNTVNSGTTFIYQFSNFDDFCNFTNFLNISMSELKNYFSNSNSLYKYNDTFILVLRNFDEQYLAKLSSIICEFATSIPYSDLIMQKIKEYGNLVCKDFVHK